MRITTETRRNLPEIARFTLCAVLGSGFPPGGRLGAVLEKLQYFTPSLNVNQSTSFEEYITATKPRHTPPALRARLSIMRRA